MQCNAMFAQRAARRNLPSKKLQLSTNNFINMVNYLIIFD
jgi:hypothetical protein